MGQRRGMSRISHAGSRTSLNSGGSISEIDCPFIGAALGAHFGAQTTATYRKPVSFTVDIHLP